MASTVIIADDLTGALDSGVCLLPAQVTVAVSAEGLDADRMGRCEGVLSVNAQSRHLQPAVAGARVAHLVGCARQSGATCVVKKTDSALRGNVGAELAAALRASGSKRLHFLPALPRMARVTKEGIHTIDGVPVAQSAFGRDPFEPVRTSRLDELIARQTDVPVHLVAEDDPVPTDATGIVVYDVTSEDDMLSRVRELRDLGELGMLAGCAGLTEALAEVLDLDVAPEQGIPDVGNLLVVCGSVNAVSQGQCRFAEAMGAATFHIGAAQKADPAWVATPAGELFCERVRTSWAANRLTVIDGSGRENLLPLVPPATDVRQLVADDIARIAVASCDGGARGLLLVMGGDVLSSFLVQAGVREVRPLGELAPGIVGFALTRGGHQMVVASKSGGFGTKDLFVSLAKTSMR